jgi:membrane protein YdbS with pleckstrin-like domain
MTGRGYGERRRGDRLVLRAWRMPLISAFLWCCVIPLVCSVGLALVAGRLETERTDTVAGAAVLLVWLLCLVPAVRSLTARVVADSDGMTVHNALSTVRVAWVDVEDIHVIDAFNAQALVNALWYGVAVRVRGRARPVRMLASWARREER